MRRWFDWLGIERKHNKYHGKIDLDEIPVADLEKEYRIFGSPELVGKHYGVSKETVRKILRNNCSARIRYPSYNDSNFRIGQVNSFFSKIKKEPSEIKYSDFFDTKREDGKTYSGLLYWYTRHYKCSPSEAIRIIGKELNKSPALKSSNGRQ